MKQPILLVLLILSFFGNLTSQTTISLTFTADVNRIHQPLDSILILNITQGGDTTLYAPDTVLVPDHGIGIEDNLNGHGNQMILFIACRPETRNKEINSSIFTRTIQTKEDINYGE